VSSLPVHDPGSSRAVLIAVDDYPPAAAPGPASAPGLSDNLERLSALLTDPGLLGLAPEHCVVLRNPPDAATVLDAVYEAATAATGAFVLYVAGFTLSTPRHPDLYFALAGSSESRLYRALRYPDLAALVRDTGQAQDRVVILDYCYDGPTPPTHAAGVGGSADLEAVPGACVLAATARDAESWVPAGQPYTAFTGALLRAAENGMPDEGEALELAALHHRAARDLADQGLPAPRMWPAHGERPIPLVRNAQAGAQEQQEDAAESGGQGDAAVGAAVGVGEGSEAQGVPQDLEQGRGQGGQGRDHGQEQGREQGQSQGHRQELGPDQDLDLDPDEVNTLPQVPDGQAPALAMAPPDLADWVGKLRATGWPQVADEVLAGVAGHALPSNAALLLVLLRLAGRDAEADRAASVVVQRPPGQCADAVLALVRNGYREECDRLLAEAGARPPEQVNRLLRTLVARGGVPQAALLLAEGTGRAPAGAALEPYAEALGLLGGPRQAGPLLAEATAHWAEGRVLTLAEELEAAGAEAASYPLYGRAAQLAAGNWPPDRFAGLLHRMSDAGAQDEIEALLGAAEKAVGPYPSLTAYLATALATSQVPSLAARLLDHTVPSYSDVELVALASYLEAGRQRVLAVHAYATAALSRPPSATLSYIDVLRRHGEPANADKLVVGVLTGRPAHVVGLLAALRAAGRTADVDRVLTLAAQGPSELAGAVSRELWEAHAEQDAVYVLDGIATRPLVELAGALVALADSGGISAARLDPHLRDRAPQEFIDAVSVLRTAQREQEAELLFAALSRGGPGQVCAAALALAQAGRGRDASELLEGFAVQAAPAEAVEAMSLLAETRGGAQAAGEVLITALAARPDPGSVLTALRRVRDPVQTDRYLEHLGATMPVSDLVALTSNLALRGCESEADLMLNRAAGRDDFTELRAAFHDAGRHAQAYHLTERRGEF